MQRDAADKLDALVSAVRGEMEREAWQGAGGAAGGGGTIQQAPTGRRPPTDGDPAEVSGGDSRTERAGKKRVSDAQKKDWLQLGYKIEETVFCESDLDGPNIPESKENPEWSHLGSNQGPPACEAGALTN